MDQVIRLARQGSGFQTTRRLSPRSGYAGNLSRRKLLYRKCAPVSVEDKLDLRPYLPEDVYEFDIRGGVANPYGIVMEGLRVHVESMYSSQLPLSRNQRARLAASRLLKRKDRHNGTALSVTHAVYDNFYHFTVEVLVRIFLLRKHLEDPQTKIIMPVRLASYHKQWLDLLGLTNRVISVQPNRLVRPDKLITCSFAANSSNQHPEILDGFREWVFDKVRDKCLDYSGPKKVFVGRKAGQRRDLMNREEVIALFMAHGYSYMEMDERPLIEQILIFKNATHIAAIHGAALGNLVFANKKAHVLELINSDFHIHFYEKICMAIGIEYKQVRSEPEPSNLDAPDVRTVNHADFFIPLIKLENVVRRA